MSGVNGDLPLAPDVYKIAVFDVGQVLFVFFVLVTWLQRQNGTRPAAGQVVLGFLKTPVIAAILAGIIFSVTVLTSSLQGFRLTGAFESVFNLLGNLTQPLICLAIGYELRLRITGMLRPLITVLLPPPFVIPIYMPQEAAGESSGILNVISLHIVLTLAAFLILVSVAS